MEIRKEYLGLIGDGRGYSVQLLLVQRVQTHICFKGKETGIH